eukprot:scaffold549_cov117-Isochrysis_galbana.AAC.8
MQRRRAHLPGRLRDRGAGSGQPAHRRGIYLTKTPCRSHRAHRPPDSRQRWQKRGPAVRVVGLAGAGHRTCKKTIWHGVCWEQRVSKRCQWKQQGNEAQRDATTSLQRHHRIEDCHDGVTQLRPT